MPLVTNGRNSAADGVAAAATWISVHTGDPGTTGTNEATGGSPAYARKQTTWSAASGGTRAGSQVTIDVAAATYYAAGLWSASTAGTFYGWLPLNGSPKGVGTAATDDTITSNGHGLVDTDRVVVFAVMGEALPTGLTAGVFYFVVSSATNTFKLSTTSGGSAVDITAVGELAFSKVVPEVFGAQGQLLVTPTIDATGL